MYNLIEEAKIQTKELYKDYLFKEEAIEILEMLNDYSDEYYEESVYDIYEELDYSLFSEGFNMTIYKKYRNICKECSKILKENRKLIKAGEYKKAMMNIDKCVKILSTTMNEIKSLEDDSFLSFIISQFLGSFIGFKKVMLATIITLPVSGVGGMVLNLKNQINDLVTLLNLIKKKVNKDNEEVRLSDLNKFKLRTISEIKGTINDLKKIKDIIYNLSIYEVKNKKK